MASLIPLANRGPQYAPPRLGAAKATDLCYWLQRFRAKDPLGPDPSVATRSRRENASRRKIRASVLVSSEPARPWSPHYLVQCFACGMSQPLDLILNHQFSAL